MTQMHYTAGDHVVAVCDIAEEDKDGVLHAVCFKGAYLVVRKDGPDHTGLIRVSLQTQAAAFHVSVHEIELIAPVEEK
jgi:hypothetical protein